MAYKFIYTVDEKTRQKLLELGFVEIPNNENMYTFLNQPLKFDSNIDLSKLKYSNMLNI